LTFALHNTNIALQQQSLPTLLKTKSALGDSPMQMSVSPKEIAEHLVSELGHPKAVETYKYHLGRCIESETAQVWNNIGSALESMQPGSKR
jgi:hypothetical protein